VNHLNCQIFRKPCQRGSLNSSLNRFRELSETHSPN
jgi:hypothetical protein